MPHLDRYEDDGLDAEPDDYDEEAELEARLRAEAALDDRDDPHHKIHLSPSPSIIHAFFTSNFSKQFFHLKILFFSLPLNMLIL